MKLKTKKTAEIECHGLTELIDNLQWVKENRPTAAVDVSTYSHTYDSVVHRVHLSWTEEE